MRIKMWHLLLVLLLSVLIPITVILASQGASKDAAPTCRGNHTRKDFYKSLRMLEPANVLEIVDNRVNYATANEGIELGSFELEHDYSVVPKDFATKHSGCYGITYCSVHLVALSIDEIPAKFCQTIEQ
jgi:hypothetical protein